MGTSHVVRARYVVGYDGAHSRVRAGIGRKLSGDLAKHAWGVMDVLPRAGGYLVRLYVDLGIVSDANRSEVRTMSAEEAVTVANRVLHPCTLEVADTAWFWIHEVAHWYSRPSRVRDSFVAGSREWAHRCGRSARRRRGCQARQRMCTQHD